jgi:hypothetical protein
MATGPLEFCESWSWFQASAIGIFDNTAINGALLLGRWTSKINVAGVFTSDAFGKYYNPGANGYLYKTMTHRSGWTVGFRFRIPNLGPAILWTGWNNDQALCNITVNADGTLTVRAGQSGAGNPLIGTTNAAVHSGKFYYGELSCELTGTTNINVAIKLRVNGEQLLDANANSGINQSSLTSGTTTINRHSITGSADYRDLYFNSAANTFRGDVKILGVRPNGDVVSQMTPTGGGAHYTQVNEEFSDSDTTTVSDSVVGHQDIWDWEDIPGFSGTIQAIQVSINARKDDEGSRAFEIVTGDTGTEAASPDFYVADDYVCCHTPQDVDPATGLAYTRAGFNAKRFGVKITV